MPIVDSNHFQLVCIIDALTPDKRQILCFDSLCATGYPSNHRELVQFSLFTLRNIWASILPSIPFEQRYIAPNVLVPIQPNMYDCGVFLLLTATHLAKKKDMFLDDYIPNQYDLSLWYTRQQGVRYRNHIVDNISLQPGQWLTDNALSTFLVQLFGNDNDIIQIPPTIYTHWQQYGTENLHEWAMGNTYDQLFHGLKTWMVPINESGHWQMLCIIKPGSLIHCSMFVFDSLSRTGVPGNINSLREFAKALIVTGKTYLTGVLSNEQIPLRNVTVKAPIQENGFDCGVCCIANMKKFVREKADFFADNIPPIMDRSKWYTSDFVTSLRKEMCATHLELFVNVVEDTM